MELILNLDELATVTLPYPLPETVRIKFQESEYGHIYGIFRSIAQRELVSPSLLPQYNMEEAVSKLERIAERLRYLQNINYAIGDVDPDGVVTLVTVEDPEVEDDEEDYENDKDAEEGEDVRP